MEGTGGRLLRDGAACYRARQDGSQHVGSVTICWDLSLRSLDAELLHPRFERGGLHAKELGRSSLTADPPSRPLEHHDDVLSLHVLERSDAHLAAAACGRRQASSYVELRAFAQDHRSLDDVLELAHVARPGIRLEHLHGFP